MPQGLTLIGALAQRAVMAAFAFALLLCAGEASALAQEATGLVQVQDSARNPRHSVTGVVVGPGNKIITASAFVIGRPEVFVRLAPNGVAHRAAVDAADPERGIALLSVQGGEPIAPRTFSQIDVARGSAIFVAYAERTGGDGQAGGRVVNPSVRRSPAQAPAQFWIHNAPIGSQAYGAALVNQCGELVGLTIANPFDARPNAVRAPLQESYALRRSDVLDFLARWGVSAQLSLTPCTSATQAAEERIVAEPAPQASADGAADAPSANPEQADESPEARLERAEAEARQAREEAERLRQEAQRIRSDQRASEQRKREAEAAAQAAQAVAEAAAVAEANLAEELRAREASVQTLEGDIEARERMLIHVAAGSLAALLLLGAVAFALVRARGRKAKRAEAGLADVVRQLNEAFPDVECRGEDALGRPHAFKIPGAALLRPPQKLTIGRQPESANIVLTHPEISRTHATIVRVGDGVAIIDEQSTNGTFVNGERLAQGEVRVLRDGDQLGLGKITFTVRYIHAQ